MENLFGEARFSDYWIQDEKSCILVVFVTGVPLFEKPNAELVVKFMYGLE
jgi:hypothetical protein